MYKDRNFEAIVEKLNKHYTLPNLITDKKGVLSSINFIKNLAKP